MIMLGHNRPAPAGPPTSLPDHGSYGTNTMRQDSRGIGVKPMLDCRLDVRCMEELFNKLKSFSETTTNYASETTLVNRV